MVRSMAYAKRFRLVVLTLALVFVAVLVLLLMAQPRLVLLPQGINRVPSCEEPADIAGFSLTPCPEPSLSGST